MTLLFLWWGWALAAIVFLLLEVMAPGFVFLGFGVGAGVVALLRLFGALGGNAPLLVLVFAAVSLVAWYAMRRLFGIRKGQVKVWDKDINDDL